MVSYNPEKIGTRKVQELLLGSVIPRPIALASTLDKNGRPNLSPFSFFNAFGANPPILIFSPSRRGRDNTTKHTYENVKQIREVVINIVDYKMVEQMSLSSTEYAAGVDEFIKAGLTKVPAEKVKPYRVKESPVQFECEVMEVIETGTSGGAGNLVIAKILMVHLNENILDKDGKISSVKLDAVGRLGGNEYIRTIPEAIFEIKKPSNELSIGIDALPEKIRLSDFFTGNELGKMGSLFSLPASEEISQYQKSTSFSNKLTVQQKARTLLKQGKTYEALLHLMALLP